LVLSACTYSQINPQRAQEQIRENNGYYELGDVAPGTAKLIVRSRNMRYPVHYSVSTSPQACKDFESVGNVAFFGQGVVYPWISRATRMGSGDSQPYRVYEVKQPGQPIQLRAVGTWTTGADGGYRSGQCGPLVVRYTPLADHAYTAEFVWQGDNSCHLELMDASVPDAPQPLPSTAVPNCQ